MIGSVRPVSFGNAQPTSFQSVDKQEKDPVKQHLTPDIYAKDEYAGKKKGRTKKLFLLAALVAGIILLSKKAGLSGVVKKAKDAANAAAGKAEQTTEKATEKVAEKAVEQITS